MPTVEPVDRLEFQVLIDNVTDSLSSAPANITLEWPALMRGGMRQLSGKCQCCANHGLALVVTATRGTLSHTILSMPGPWNSQSNTMGLAWALTSVASTPWSCHTATGIMPAGSQWRLNSSQRQMAAVRFPAICILACSASAHCRFLEGDYCLSKKSRRQMISQPRALPLS